MFFVCGRDPELFDGVETFALGVDSEQFASVRAVRGELLAI
jgi:hypothetical protein